MKESNLLKILKKSIVKKSLELLEKLTANTNEYEKFYKQFGKNLKIGVKEDPVNCKRISELLRYYTSHSGDELTSLHGYVSRMKKNQKEIYFISGESKEAVYMSALIEKHKQLGKERERGLFKLILNVFKIQGF